MIKIEKESTLFIYMTIFFGGGLGAVTRYVLSSFVSKQTSPDFPYGTLSVNLLGAFAIGLVMAVGAYKFQLSETTRAFLVTGILGGFTTFSAFSLETSLLLTRGAYAQAGLYVGISVIGTVLLVFAANMLVRSLT